jgi:hypothetical protein
MNDPPLDLTDSHLGNIIHIAHTRASRDFGRIDLIPVQLGIDILGNGGERHRRVLCPKEVFGVKVVRFLLKSTVFWGLKGSYA